MSDSRHRYGTEPAVGAAIKKSGIPRSKIFITTKVRHPLAYLPYKTLTCSAVEHRVSYTMVSYSRIRLMGQYG